jgi:coenzyme PQQ synthesis protein D (PqqD)
MRIPQPPVSHECIDGEVVIINMETGTYYSLLGVASSLWQSIVGGTTYDRLLARFDADVQSEVRAFLHELAQERLVDLHAEPAQIGADIALPAYSTPRVEKFTDLQELLMLDPIHEVDAAGWPHKS